MLAYTSRLARSYLNPDRRQQLKRVVDSLMGPLGSIDGALKPTDTVVLTFDDGPDPEVTPKLLDLLRRRGVRATFFLLSEKAAGQADLVRRIVQDGHEIGLHFDRHDRVTQLPVGTFKDRLHQARRQLEQLVGPVHLFRPPFGAQSLATFCVTRFEGLDVVVWGPYAEDWTEQSSESAAGKVLGRVVGGDVVLLHDGLELPPGEPRPSFDRVRMVELILDGLAERGLKTDSLGPLIANHGTRRSTWFRA